MFKVMKADLISVERSIIIFLAYEITLVLIWNIFMVKDMPIIIIFLLTPMIPILNLYTMEMNAESDKILNSFPAKRSAIVAARYLHSIVFLILGFILGYVMIFLSRTIPVVVKPVAWPTYYKILVISLPELVMAGVFLPLYFFTGKYRIPGLTGITFFVIVFWGVSKCLKNLPDKEFVINSIMLVVATILFYVISYFVSVCIYRRRQFY